MKTICQILLAITCSLCAQNQDVLAVIDLQNGGGVSRRDIDVVCDAIADRANMDGRYFVFDRSLVPQVLQETGIPTTGNCSHQQCLATMGNLLAAQKVIGGSIKREGNKTTIELLLVNVASATVDNSIVIEKKTSRTNMIDIHLPPAVARLMSGKRQPAQAQITKKRKSRWWLPVTGLLAIGAAGAGAYMYLEKEQSSGENGGGAIPMDDVPVRTR